MSRVSCLDFNTSTIIPYYICLGLYFASSSIDDIGSGYSYSYRIFNVRFGTSVGRGRSADLLAEVVRKLCAGVVPGTVGASRVRVLVITENFSDY